MDEISTVLCSLALEFSPEWSSLAPYWENVKDVANSSFTTSLAGAFAGAWGAQHIAERSKVREELQKEIRNTNTGMMLALSTANLALALKKQHVKALKESYEADCRAREEFVQRHAAGQNQGPFQIAPNLNSLHEISPPVATLQEIVLGRLSTTGRAPSTVSELANAFGNLNHAIMKRNELIDMIKSEKLPEGAKVHHFYFGIPYAEGKANQEFGSYVKALGSYTDDAIFFSLKLCDDLREHGLHVAEKHKKKFRGDAPGVSNFDWSQAKEEDLLPKDEDYESWLSGFQSPAKKKRSWWPWMKAA